MTVDLEAIARRSDSDLSALKLALPLIEQGFAPPFLARYRRDELGGVGEGALWTLMRSIRSDRALGVRREELMKVWQRTRLADSSLEKAIRDAKSKSAISRVARRLKNEPQDPAATIAPEVWVASRILNPEPGDSGDIAALAAAVGQGEHLDQVNAGLDRALAKRLAEHPQIQAAAVRWLTANASIRFLEVSDPNIESRQESEAHVAPAERPETEPGANWPSPEQLGAETAPAAKPAAQPQPAAADTTATDSSAASAEPAASDAEPSTDTAATSRSSSLPPAADALAGTDATSLTAEPSPAEPSPAEAVTTPTSTPGVEPTATAAEPTAGSDSAAVAEATSAAEPQSSIADEDAVATGATAPQPTGETAAATDTAEPSAAVAQTPAEAATTTESTDKKPPGKKAKKAKPIVKQTKVFKKLSPRQRRRRWLIGILQPLVGKQVPIKNLSPFQTMVLSRALRANLVRCQFVYDANQLIAQLHKTAAGLNPAQSERLSTIVAEHEASIREITESVWWDELQDVATNRLVDLTAAHLDEQLHRGAVEAKTVLALDAVGPRTSPVSIVASDGRLLHTEDIASQLENELRTASVTRLGELIHRFGVDLIVISNGPARRAAMIILGELIAQSPEGSIRWTIAERSGADAYASCELADREMRVTPRRFRAAAWLAFSLLKPAWALAKVDPLKLRLAAAQRELPEELLAPSLHDVMSSAVSRGGLDVNSAAIDSLAQLPGVTRKVAEAIDRQRRISLFTSREQLLALEEWPDEMHGRQAIGFLRVFGGEEPLDATVIHPEDYSLARKLAKALNLELPPAAPPGYQPPSFDEPKAQPDSQPAAEATTAESADNADVTDQDDSSPFAAELLGDASPQTADDQPADQAAELASAAEASTAETSAESAAPTADTPAAETAAAATGEGDSAAQPVAAAEPAAAESAPQPTGRQPLPDPAAINKCIREWQVGSSRAHRLVHALCDPFGEESLAKSGEAPAVLTQLPKAGTLRPGDQVIGVVASVAPFGAFVEISPELTGLVRVSRLAEEFVEEIHDFIQVGDVVTAWVTEIDSRRRLQLSALSPQREEELRRQRQEQREHRSQHRRGGPGRGERGGQGGQGHGGQAHGGQAAGQGRQGDRPAGRGGQGGQGGGRTAPRGEPRRGGRDDARRGDNRGRGGRREEPISYTTRVSKNAPPATPITEAMAEGKEPLRSFGDLLQFMKKDAPAAPSKNKPAAGKAAPPAKPATDADKADEPQGQAQTDAPQAAAPSTQQAPPESAPPSPAPPSPGVEAGEPRSEPTAANDNPA